MESRLLTSSNIKITPEDWALTPSSIQQALLQVLERLAALEEEVSHLRAETERLREQTRRSSRTSSQPPRVMLRVRHPGSHAPRVAASVVLSPVTKGISASSTRSKCAAG
jgi:hypothetical protein